MDPPPMAEGSSTHVEWLDECMPQLASESEDDDSMRGDDTDDDASTTDEDEDDGGQMELEEPRQQRKRTNESDMSQASKRAREPRSRRQQRGPPAEAKSDEEQSRDKIARKFDFTGKEEKEGKVRRFGKDTEKHFCFPGKPSPCPTKSRAFLLVRSKPDRLEADLSTNDGSHEGKSEGTMQRMPVTMQSMVEHVNDEYSDAELEQDLAYHALSDRRANLEQDLADIIDTANIGAVTLPTSVRC